jgi:hypothetical protein
MRLLMRDRQNRAQHHVIRARGETHNLPSADQVDREVGNRKVFDQNSKQPLVQLLGKIELLQAPPGCEPGFRHQKEHRLAAIGGFVQRALPTFATRNAALRIKIEEDFILPAVIGEPVAQGDCLGIVAARMAEKDVRHVSRLEATSSQKESIETPPAVVTAGRPLV